ASLHLHAGELGGVAGGAGKARCTSLVLQFAGGAGKAEPVGRSVCSGTYARTAAPGQLRSASAEDGTSEEHTGSFTCEERAGVAARVRAGRSAQVCAADQ